MGSIPPKKREQEAFWLLSIRATRRSRQRSGGLPRVYSSLERVLRDRSPACLGLRAAKTLAEAPAGAMPEETPSEAEAVAAEVDDLRAQAAKVANDLKVQGNAALQTGNLATACALYSQAIDLDGSNHVLPAPAWAPEIFHSCPGCRRVGI